jgi:hypothetical protein
MDREKVIKGLECHADRTNMSCNIAKCPYYELDFCGVRLSQDALALLKEHELPTELKQKMWNALYVEEDEYEKKFVGKEEHLNWFTVYRPWLQKGFDIAINAIANWEGR